jgi:hypothetical protein
MNHRFRLLGWAMVLGVLLAQQSPAALRKVLAELITSTTCAPCYSADVFYFQNWLPNYGGADQIVTLAYHVWWPSPGNDPLYLANPVPVQNRVAYYFPTVASAPYLFVDGFISGGSGYTTWPGAIEPRFLDASPVSITLTGTRNGNILEMNASITADQVVNSSSWRVHWVIQESGLSVPQNSGSGYVPFVHEYVHRGMYPDANGSPIAISNGQTVDIPRTLTLGAGWVPENCRVVVFVQNNTDKKVQNAEVIAVDMLTGVGDTPGGIPSAFGLEQNYPNPFNPATTITFSLPSRGSAGAVSAAGTMYATSLQVFDVLGRRVATLVNDYRAPGRYTVSFDASRLAGGTYFCRLTAGGQQDTRRMMLLR